MTFKPSDHGPKWEHDEPVGSCECGDRSVTDFRTWRDREDAWNDGARVASRAAVILGIAKDLPDRTAKHNPHAKES